MRVVGQWPGGWRKPLESVELYDDRHQLLGIFPAALLVDLLSHHLRGALLAGVVRETLAALEPDAPLAPVTPPKPLRGANGRKLRGRL